MQQRLKISGLFLVAHAQLAIVVHPRVGAFDHPATGFALGAMPRLGRSFRRHMRNVSARSYFLLRGFARVALIHAQMLRSFPGWFRPPHHDRVQGLGQQFHIVPIGPGDDKRERGATTVHQQAAFGSFFFPDRSDCFPPPRVPGALCLACRPSFAIPTRCLPSRHTPPAPRATNEQKPPLCATVGNTRGWRWRCRNSWATPATDSPCAAHRRWPQKWCAAPSVCGRRRVCAGTCALAVRAGRAAAATVQLSTKARRKLPKIEHSACKNHGTNTKHRQLLFKDKILLHGGTFGRLLPDAMGWRGLGRRNPDLHVIQDRKISHRAASP